MIRLLLFFVAGIFPFQLTAQDPDSIHRALKQVHPPATRVELLNKAVYAGIFSEPEQAEKYSIEAIALAKKAGLQNELALAYRLRGVLYMEGYDRYAESAAYLDTALIMFTQLNDSFNIAKANNNLGALNYYQGNRDHAVLYWDRALQLFSALKNETEVSNVFFNLGNLMMEKGEYEAARKHFTNNLNVCIKNKNIDGQAIARVQIGNTYSETGQFDKALPEFMKAIELSEKSGNKLYLTHALGYAAYIFKTMGSTDKAISFYKRSYDVAAQSKNPTAQANSLISLGNIYMEGSNPDTGLAIVQKAEAIYREMGDQRGTATCYRYYGDYYKLKNKYNLALKNYYEAMTFPAALENEIFKGNVLHLLGFCYNDIRKLPENDRPDSLKSETLLMQRIGYYLESARVLAEENDHTLILKNIHEVLAEIYEQQGKFRESLQHYRKFIAFRDSVFSEETTVKIAGLEAKHDLELRQKELVLQKMQVASAKKDTWFAVSGSLLIIAGSGVYFYRYRKQQRSKREEELEAVRHRISRDLHDEVGSTLSAMNLLSHSAARRLRGNDHEKAEVELQKMQENALQVQETMSDIVWNIKPESDKLENVLVRMREYASTLFESGSADFIFKEDIDDDQVVLTPDLKNNLYRIFKESLNNCIRHSGCSAATAEIVLQNDHLVFRLKDNGKGIPGHRMESGNGLRNMRQRAAELGAVLNIFSSENGTILEFECQITRSGDRLEPSLQTIFTA